jgi:hypothetical protein
MKLTTTEVRTRPIRAGARHAVGIARYTEFRIGGAVGVLASYLRPVAVEVAEPGGVVARRRIVDIDLALRCALLAVALMAVLRGRTRG